MQEKLKHSWSDFICLALPECVTVSMLICLPIVVDLFFISKLQSMCSYQSLSISTNILHLLAKLSEATSVATITLVGSCNGASNFKQAGQSLFNSLASALILGFIQLSILFCGIHLYLVWMGVEYEVCVLAAKFLKIQSLAILFSFIHMPIMGFFRGIKNTYVPMTINVLGILVFLLCDYILIFGKLGFPAFGLLGSASASVLRYLFMIGFSLLYILWNKSFYRKFFSWSQPFNVIRKDVYVALSLSIPIMLDKTVLSVSYIWLYKMLMPTFQYALPTIEVIKNIERIAFVPALAFAQVTSLVVSNNFGAGHLKIAQDNIKKISILSVLSVTTLLCIIFIKAEYFVSLFDVSTSFTTFAALILRLIAVFVVLDVLQVIFAAALRGIGQVSTVMYGRIVGFGLFFFPVSWFIRFLPVSSEALFFLIYSSFFVSIGIVALIFYFRLVKCLRKTEDSIVSYDQPTVVRVQFSARSNKD